MASMPQLKNFAELELRTRLYMKPATQITRQPTRLDDARSSSRRRSTQLQTDCNFHAPATEVRSAGRPRKITKPSFAPGFRELSNEFLGAETRRSYVAEAVFFAIIVAVSAWPIVSMLQALAFLTK